MNDSKETELRKDLRTSFHWTSVARGPNGLALFYCSVEGLVDAYLNFEDARQDAFDHAEEHNRWNQPPRTGKALESEGRRS